MSGGVDLAIMARQWKELTGRDFRPRACNHPDRQQLRLDNMLHDIAECAFDDATFLDRLARLSAAWLSRCNCETTRAIAGYVAYMRNDFSRAATFFLSCIAEQPLNLDSWCDLAFALNHLGDPLGRHILFNLDEFARRFASCGDRVCTLGRLQDIHQALLADGADYTVAWPRWFHAAPEDS